MMQPTKEQWDEIAEQLDSLLVPVYLRCDGHLVHAMMTRVGKNSLGIVVGVNGYSFKGFWYREGWEQHEEPRRFWRPVKRQKMSAKELKAWERFYGKRECRKKGFYEPLIRPHPVWNRPRPFIAHLRKHNQHIEVLDYDTYQAELDTRRSQEAEVEA